MDEIAIAVNYVQMLASICERESLEVEWNGGITVTISRTSAPMTSMEYCILLLMRRPVLDVMSKIRQDLGTDGVGTCRPTDSSRWCPSEKITR